MLWLLPAGGGEARVLATRPGGVGDVRVAADAGTVAVTSATFPSSHDEEQDQEKGKARKDGKVSAILHESMPVRFWDDDLGPASPRLFAGTVSEEGLDPRLELTDLTPDAGRALERSAYDRQPGRLDDRDHLEPRPSAAACASAWRWSTSRRASGGCCSTTTRSEYAVAAFSPDGRTGRRDPRAPAPRRTTRATSRLVVVDVADGSVRDLSGDWDHWPAGGPEWTPDGTRAGAHRRRGRPQPGLPRRRRRRGSSPG